jgi:hypothetical protein
MNSREEVLAQQAENYVKHACYRLTKSVIKSCQVSHPEFSNEHAKKLASDLPLSTKLRKLEIVKCPKLNGQGISRICGSLRRSSVSHLSFENVPIGDDGLQAIQDLLNDGEASLRFLGLEEIGPISDSVWDTFLSVASRKVQSLDLSRNSLTQDRMVELANGLEATNSLTALILSENPIGDDGMEQLCHAVCHNRSLMLLAIGDCQITDRGIHALSQALRSNCSLQRLYVYGNSGVNLNSDDNLETRYWLDLNAGHRAFLRSNDCLPGFLPEILAKSSKRQELLYGLLRELPHVWAPSNE